MVDLYAANGSTVDQVETEQNNPGVMDPILKVNPDRGTFLRFLNHVSKGTASGLPLYFKLRDSNGDLLPQNTDIQLKAQVAGMNGWMNVSELVQSINYWNTNDLTTQRDKDNVDNVKVNLTHPEASGKAGARESVDVRDIDTLAVAIDSAAQVDWSQSEYYFESNAVEEHSRG
jgi:hypothetical protein